MAAECRAKKRMALRQINAAGLKDLPAKGI